MHEQGKIPSQFRPGPPIHTPPFPPGPPPPPPYHQGFPSPPQHVRQQFPSAPPPNVGWHGRPPVFEHRPPGPAGPSHQVGPQLSLPLQTTQAPVGVSGGKTFMHPRPLMHGSSSMEPSYTSSMHNANYHLPRPPLPGAPLPPRMLPPPPSQGQMLYRSQFLPPLPQPAISGQPLHHGQFLPPPPSSGFVPPTPASFAHSSLEDVHPPSLSPPPPPPPPSSPPPLPSLPPSSNVNLLRNSVLSCSKDELSVTGESGLVSVAVADPAQAKDDLVVNGGPQKGEGGTIIEIEPTGKDKFSEVEESLFISPPKPAQPEITRNIEVMCQFIAKNGSCFEEMAREKERGNPKFAFLYGGEEGSEAANAHAYFQWMKRKCQTETKQHDGSEHVTSLPKQSETEDSSHSHQYSDMDMEDDVNQSEEENKTRNVIEGSREHVSVDCEVKVQQHEYSHAVEHPAYKDSISTTASGEEGRENYQSMRERSPGRDYIPSRDSTGAIECNISSDGEKSMIPLSKDSSMTKVSAADVSVCSEDVSGSLMKCASPFKLLQDYASDDDVADDDRLPFEDVSPIRALTPVVVGNKSSQEDATTSQDVDVGTEIVLVTEELDFYQESHEVVEVREVVSESLEAASELQNKTQGKQKSGDRECKDLQGDVNIDPQSNKSENDRLKQGSSASRVDEFGRLVREEASDSDSDRGHYTGRRSRRDRSRSKSRSPHRRRRRKSRSPRRRKEKRNRSRSRTPERQRRRSNSPPFRRTSENTRDKMRQDRGHIPDCFDFLRGRCYRGTSCRFIHRGSTNGDESRNRSRHQQGVEAPQDSRKVDLHGDSHLSVQKDEDEYHSSSKVEVKRQEMYPELLSSSTNLQRDGETNSDSAMDGVQPFMSSEAGQQPSARVCKEDHQSDSKEAVVGQQVSRQESIVQPNKIEFSDTATFAQSISQPSLVPPTQLYPVSTSMSQIEGHPVNSSNPPSLKSGEPQSLGPKDLKPSIFSSLASNFQASQLPLSLPFPQGSNTEKPMPIPPPVAAKNIHDQSGLEERLLPYQAPFQDQQSQSSAPSKLTWTSLPPPPSYISEGTTNSTFHNPTSHPQSQQNSMPLRNEFPQHVIRPHAQEKSHYQAAEFQNGAFPPPVDSMQNQVRYGGYQFHPGPQPDLLLQPHFREYPSHIQGNQRFASHSQDFTTSTSLAQGGMHPMPVSFPRELSTKNIPSFPDDSLLSRSFSRENYGTHSTGNLSYMHPQHLSYSGQQSAADGIPSHLVTTTNVDPSMSRYPSSLLDNSKVSQLSDVGGSKVAGSFHHNPFASTFEQTPTDGRFTSVLRPEMDPMYKTKFDMLGSSGSGQGTGGFESSLKDLPLDSSRSGGLDSKSKFQKRSVGGDQYDPLFDSIESSSSRKFGNIEEQDSKSGVSKPGSTRAVEAKADATMSEEEDEFGETAIDAEVGAVENDSPQPGEGGNWSPENPVDLGNPASGDEADQVQTSGKGKKSKDSRSMKLLRISLASFVKEVLKPSWRQGNMSKEAFKTIVKKTVDKVTGAMKKHHIPKSQAKIDQYVESSQRKLTKLVMGYVDKYVKV